MATPTAEQLIKIQEEENIACFFAEYHELTKRRLLMHVSILEATQTKLEAVLRLTKLKATEAPQTKKGGETMQDEEQVVATPVEAPAPTPTPEA